MKVEFLWRFMEDELDNQEIYNDIVHFVICEGIRKGEYETNMYIVRKVDQDNFIIYDEYTLQNYGPELSVQCSVDRVTFFKELIKFVRTKPSKLKEFPESSFDLEAYYDLKEIIAEEIRMEKRKR